MPGAKYAARGTRTTPDTTLGHLFGETDGATPTRIWVYDMIIGSAMAPADNVAEWEVIFATGGTPAGTAVTPAALEQDNEAAATSDWLETLTTNPMTIAGEPLLTIPLNQRATFRWVAAPGGELVVAGSAGNGILWRTPVNTSINPIAVTAHFVE